MGSPSICWLTDKKENCDEKLVIAFIIIIVVIEKHQTARSSQFRNAVILVTQYLGDVRVNTM